MNGSGGREGALLVVGHPGHELVVHGWLEVNKPVVAILTDGSGGGGASRVASSRRTVEAAGGSPGEIFGSRPDREIYTALLRGDTGYFLRILEDLTDEIMRLRPAVVAGDGMEGYNPVHDLCRALIDRAVLRAKSHGVSVENYAFPVVSPHVIPEKTARALILQLDEAQVARKVKAAKAYAELGDEVTVAIEGGSGVSLLEDDRLRDAAAGYFDVSAERRLDLECLFPVDGTSDLDTPAPFYEAYGEYLAKIGKYAEVIRYEQHVAPVLRALDSAVA